MEGDPEAEMGNDNYNPNWITLLIDNYFKLTSIYVNLITNWSEHL